MTSNSISWIPDNMPDHPIRFFLDYPMVLDLARINTDNYRKINWSRVNAYKADMINRRWNNNTHQAILIGRDVDNKTLRLVDGQHRIHAAKLAMEDDPKLTVVSFLIQVGSCDSAGIDSGMSRTITQSLKISSNVVSVVNFILNRICKIPHVTASQIESFYVDQDFSLAIDKITESFKSNQKLVGRSAIRAAAVLRYKDDPDYVSAQASALALLNYDEMSPVIQSFVRQLSTMSMDNYFLCARAWVAFDPKNANQKIIRLNDWKPYFQEMRSRVRLPFVWQWS